MIQSICLRLILALCPLAHLGCSLARVSASDGTWNTSVWAFNSAVTSERTEGGRSGGGYAIVQVVPVGPYDDVDYARRDLPDGGVDITQSVRSGQGVQAQMWSGIVGSVLGFFGGLVVAGGGVP